MNEFASYALEMDTTSQMQTALEGKKVMKCSKRNISEEDLHKKKRIKSDEQKRILQQYFDEQPSIWERPMLLKLSDLIGLSIQAIYKWNWDKVKRLEKGIVNEQ